MPVWVWVVYALAVARLTGLVAVDEISRPARDWIVEHLPRYPASVAVEYLLTCVWCVSVWVAAVTVAAAWHWGARSWLLGPALVLALSQAAGMTSTLGRPASAAEEHDDAPVSLHTRLPYTLPGLDGLWRIRGLDTLNMAADGRATLHLVRDEPAAVTP